MRFNQYKAFEKHLQSSFSSSLYCLIMKDAEERSLAFDALKKQVQPETILIIEEEKQLASALDSFSFFSGKQLLHVQGCEKFSKGMQTLLEKQIPSIPSSCVLVLSGERFSRENAFYKLVEKHGIILDLSEEKLWEKEKSLAEWLVEKAHQAKKTLDPRAVNALARGSQNSRALLAKEWDKLLTYVGERSSITFEDVESICSLSTLDSNWALGESLLAQNSKEALETAHRMLDQGISPFSILRGLRHQIKTAFFLSLGEAERFPYLKGHMLEKQVKIAQEFGRDRLQTALQLIDYFEFKAKDVCDDPKLLLTLLCAKVIPS